MKGRYETHIFEEDRKKILKDKLKYIWMLLGVIGAITFILIELSIFAYGLGITLLIYVYHIYNDDKNDKGLSSYGQRKRRLVIEEDCFIVDDRVIPFKELKNLVIYVDEYFRQPRQYFGYYHGGNNEITFERNGDKVSFNYIIKSKKDFKNLENLVSKIESKHSSHK